MEGGGQHPLCPSPQRDFCRSSEGKLGLLLPLVSASLGLLGESEYDISQRACSFTLATVHSILLLKYIFARVGLPASFSPARLNLLLCQVKKHWLSLTPCKLYDSPLYNCLFAALEINCTYRVWSRNPSQPYVHEEVVKVLGADQGRKASAAISGHFPET